MQRQSTPAIMTASLSTHRAPTLQFCVKSLWKLKAARRPLKHFYLLRSLYYRVNERVNMVFCPVLFVLPSLMEEKLNYPVVFANNKTAWKHEGGRRVSVSTLSTFQR